MVEIDSSSRNRVPQRMVRPLNLSPGFMKLNIPNKVLKIAADGDIAGLRKLLAGHPEWLNKRGSHNRTLLWEAARRGKLPAVQWLVEQGAEVNATGSYNSESFVQLTPYCAAIYYHRPAVAGYLRAHGAQEDIFRAAFLGEIEPVAQMIAAQPGLLNAEDPQDPIYFVPPLSFAVVGGRIGMVAFLLERGAAVAPYSLQLLSLAARDGREDILELLLEHGAQIPALGEMYFSNTYDVDMLRFFLEHGATPGQKGANGFSPLMYFCRADKGEQPEKIELLLEYHAPVNGVGPKGRTALHYAAAAGFLEVMTLLLDHVADFRVRDHQGETPLDLARRYNRTAAENLLKDRGAME